MPKQSYKWLTVHDPFTLEPADIPPGYAARRLGVTPSTTRRWAESGIPEPHARHLAALVHGVLPDPAWHQFRAIGGCLVNMETGEKFTPADLKSVYLAHQQVAALRERLREMQRPAGRSLRLVV